MNINKTRKEQRIKQEKTKEQSKQINYANITCFYFS
jgi:hypothetical protein